MTVEREDPNEVAFRRFRPYCAALVSNPKRDTLEKLDRLINLTDPEELQRLQDYLIFPLQLYLKTPVLPENYTLLVLDVLRRLCAKTRLSSFFALKDVLTNVMLLLNKNGDGVQPGSEDMRVSCCDCLAVMVANAEDDVAENLFDEEMKLMLSHLLFTVLSFVDKDKELASVVQSSINLLAAIVPSRERPQAVKSKFSALFAQMLPGVSSGLMKLLKDNSAPVTSKTKALALDTWTLYVTVILSDECMRCKNLSPEDCDVDPWVNKARDHIAMQMQVLLALAASEKAAEEGKFAKAILGSVRSLIEECDAMSLKNLAKIQLEILACLAAKREDYCVAVDARHDLRRLLGSELLNSEVSRRSISSEAQEKVFELCEELSRLRSKRRTVGLYEREELASNLSKLHGQMLLLQETESASLFFHSETYLRALLSALCTVCRLEDKTLVIGDSDLSASGIGDISDFDIFFVAASKDSPPTRPKKSFEFLQTESLRTRFEGLIRIMSEFSHLPVVVEYLLENKHDRQREVIFILGLILTVSPSSRLHPDLLETLSAAFVDPRSWLRCDTTLAKLPYEERKPEIKTEKKQAAGKVNWSRHCLLAEGLGKLALSSQRSDWNGFRRLYLGPALVRVISETDISNTHEAHVLYAALTDLSKGSGYDSFSAMLLDNIGHLSRDLTLSLRNLSRGDSSSSDGLYTLLRIVLKLKNVGDHPGLKDTLSALLLQLDFSWTDPSSEKTAKILRTILIFVQSFESEETGVESEKRSELSLAEEKNCEKGALTNFILNLKRADDLMEAENALDSDDCPLEGFHSEKDKEDEPAGVNGAADEEEPAVVSERTQLLRDVIEHSRHFISMVKRPEWQILALDIVARCVLLIRMEKDELLPLIHLSWKPLELLFASENLFIVEKAFWCLRVFARTSKDFIHRRTLTNVFPTVVKYIRRLQVMVQDRDRHATLIARQSRRVLSDMVHGLWDFMAQLDLDEVESDAVIEEMLEFVAMEKIKVEEKSKFVPLRRLDQDILRMKLKTL